MRLLYNIPIRLCKLWGRKGHRDMRADWSVFPSGVLLDVLPCFVPVCDKTCQCISSHDNRSIQPCHLMMVA